MNKFGKLVTMTSKQTLRIISLSHSEDIDGIASQAIIDRYFRILNRKIEANLIDHKHDADEIDDVKITFLRSDYSDYLHYWAAILAQNTSGNTILESIISPEEDFVDKWQKVYEKIKNHDNMSAGKGAFKEFNHIIKSERNTIMKMSDDMKNADLVILSDLGVNKTFGSLFSFLKDVPFSIAYFDHHEHFPQAKEFFSEKCSVYTVDRSKCASQIVKDYFLPEEKTANEIVNYGIDSDFRKWELEYTENLQHIIGKFSRDYDVIEQIRQRFSKGIFFDEYIEDLHEQVQAWLKEQEEYLMDHIFFEKLDIAGWKNVEFMIGGAEMRPGRIIRVLEQKFENVTGNEFPEGEEPPNIIVGINEMTGKTNINSHAFPTIKVAQFFGGGGHLHRAGFQIPMKFVDANKLDNNYFDCLNKEALLAKIIEIFESK